MVSGAIAADPVAAEDASEAVRDRTVVSLIACRNMWYSAAIEASGLLRSAGARRVDVVAATDTRGSSTTLVTTLRWLLTGKRDPFFGLGGPA